MILYTLVTGVHLSVCAYVCWCSDRYIYVTCYACLHCVHVCVLHKRAAMDIYMSVLCSWCFISKPVAAIARTLFYQHMLCQQVVKLFIYVQYMNVPFTNYVVYVYELHTTQSSKVSVLNVNPSALCYLIQSTIGQ